MYNFDLCLLQLQTIKGIAMKHYLMLDYKAEKKKICISGFDENVSTAFEEIQK
jgi:hypothetical protein